METEVEKAHLFGFLVNLCSQLVNVYHKVVIVVLLSANFLVLPGKLCSFKYKGG